MRTPSFVRLVVFGQLVVALSVLACGASQAEWARYENDAFVVYSQGKAKRVEELVRELEHFRSAALQVFSIRAPADAPKTLVVIAKHKKEFREFGGGNGIVGFARREGGRTLIVMPAGGSMKTNLNTARHEYAHALLAYDSFDYPRWYNEGFAELAALIEVDADSGSFKLGLGTNRRLGRGEVAVDWNTLISDKFNPHGLASATAASDAYGQSWLLMHYLSLGPDAENATKLAHYVAYLKSGMSSVDAFKEAFGLMPQDLWDQDMHDYTSRLPYYHIKFRGLSLDDQFTVTTGQTAELDDLLEYLRMPETANKAKRLKDKMPQDYVGFWARPKFATPCSEPIEIRHDQARNSMSIRWEAEDGTEAESQLVDYSVEVERSGELRLVQQSETDEDHNVIPEFVATYREGEVMCLTAPDNVAYVCGQAYLRCPKP